MILIILPVRNESQTVFETSSNIVGWCKNNLDSFKVLFVDDGSTDGTFEKLKTIEKESIKVIRNQFDRGKGSTLKTGFVLSNLIYKMGSNDKIVFMDGDGQIDPIEIKTFLNLMDLYNADVVIGNKRHLFSVTRYGFRRTIVSLGYNFIIRTFFGIGYQDTQCGIKIFKKYALDRVIEKITSKKYAFDLELIIALRHIGMRIADAPVNIKPQKNSGSVSFKNIWHTFCDTINIYINIKKNLYSK